jgi:hypothetical protein
MWFRIFWVWNMFFQKVLWCSYVPKLHLWHKRKNIYWGYLGTGYWWTPESKWYEDGESCTLRNCVRHATRGRNIRIVIGKPEAARHLEIFRRMWYQLSNCGLDSWVLTFQRVYSGNEAGKESESDELCSLSQWMSHMEGLLYSKHVAEYSDGIPRNVQKVTRFHICSSSTKTSYSRLVSKIGFSNDPGNSFTNTNHVIALVEPSVSMTIHPVLTVCMKVILFASLAGETVGIVFTKPTSQEAYLCLSPTLDLWYTELGFLWLYGLLPGFHSTADVTHSLPLASSACISSMQRCLPACYIRFRVCAIKTVFVPWMICQHR